LTADYDTQFAANAGAWTTDMFVEAVYTSLNLERPDAKRRQRRLNVICGASSRATQHVGESLRRSR
jgi:hypothetical protein